MSVSNARALRKRMSPTEIRLWNVLRRRPNGLQFRRQHSFGPFVLDFYCKAAAVAVEVDGVAHDFAETAARDERRNRWVREQGVETFRIPAEEVRRNLEGAVTHIITRCLERTPPRHFVRSPSPTNAGEDEK